MSFRKELKKGPIRITVVYLVLSVLWIGVSDLVVSYLLADASARTTAQVQTLKGWSFVLVSALVIWLMVRQSSTRLADASRLLRLQGAVIENTHNAVISANADRQIIYVNRAFEDMTGFSQQDVRGKPLQSLRSGLHDEAYYERLWADVEAHGVWRGEMLSRRRNGEIYTEWVTFSRVLGDDQEPAFYVAVTSDITEQKEGRERLNYLAFYDPLTDLPNRALISEHLLAVLRRKRERTQGQVATLFVDLDDFKAVNESYGHKTGDELLKQASDRLRECIPDECLFGRFGGDVFVVVVPHSAGQETTEVFAQALLDALQEPFLLGDEVRVTTRASIGICLSPGNPGADQDTVTRLFSQADSALRQAKQLGKNAYAFYNLTMTRLARRRLRLEEALGQAVLNNELRLHYQPIFDVSSGRVCGSEALVRWQHPEWGLVSPADFIPLAEETGQISRIGEWVLEESVRQINGWCDDGLEPGFVAVNVSSRQLARGDFAAVVHNLLAQSRIEPWRLELELTESSLMTLGTDTVSLLAAIRATGVSLAIDDFGTGYSSLAYLKDFPVDKLKIDRRFVRELAEKDSDQEIVQAIIAMARALKLAVQAEGVETGAQLSILQGLSCDLFQGYFRSRPLPPEEFRKQWLGESGRQQELG